MNKIVIFIIIQFLFTTLVYPEPIGNYNHLRVPMKFGNGGARQDDEKMIVSRLLAPVMDAYRAGNYKQAVKMHNALLMLGLGLGIITNGRNREEALISKALETLDPGNVIDREKLTLDIIKTAQDKSNKMLREMTIEHDKQELRRMNQPGTVQIVRGYVEGVGIGMSSQYDAMEGRDISVLTFNDRVEAIKELVGLFTAETRSKISEGDMLLLGPGRHIHEVLMLMQIFPNLRSLYVVDPSMRNLIEIKKQLDTRKDIDKDRIKLYQADFNNLPFKDGKFTICYSRSVIDGSLHLSNKVLSAWVSELKRVLKPEGNGAYLTLGSDEKMFKNRGFILKSKYARCFVACLDGNVFSQPFLLPLVSANQQLSSSL